MLNLDGFHRGKKKECCGAVKNDVSGLREILAGNSENQPGNGKSTISRNNENFNSEKSESS